MTNNPIELLISLAVNSAKSKENVDANIKELKKYYERNPMVMNLDFDKTQAMNKLHGFIKEASKEKITLGVDFDGGDFSNISKQTKKAKDEFKELSDIATKSQKSTSKAFDIDLDRVLVQLENLGRKGIVAAEQISKFSSAVESLRGTNDRLSLKETVKDIFDISSEAGHADKVMESLNNALIKVGQTQQKMSDMKDKFNIDPNVSDQYSRLAHSVEGLTNDIIKLQTQAATGGSDEIKIAEQIRDVENRLKEATREMKVFQDAAKQDVGLSKLEEDARKLLSQMERLGNVGSGDLRQFDDNITMIMHSSESTTTKINQMTTAIDNLKDHAKNMKIDIQLAEKIESAVLASEKLEAKIMRIGTIHKNTVDKMSYASLLQQTEQLTKNLNNIENAGDLRSLTTEYKRLGAEVDKLGANAVTTARASEGMGAAFKNAWNKFPIWAITAATFYAPIRGLKDMVDNVIELDTALVNLKRVMDEPSHVFDGIITSMISNVDMLSGKTTDYMELVGEFARTGLDSNESQEYANVATVLQNISDMSPAETMNALTAAMTAFKDEGLKSIDVADKLNEIKKSVSLHSNVLDKKWLYR